MLNAIITPIALVATYIAITVEELNFNKRFEEAAEIDWNEYYAHAHN